MHVPVAKPSPIRAACLVVLAAWACSGKSATNVDLSTAGTGGSAGATTGAGGTAGSTGTGGGGGGLPPDPGSGFDPGPCDPSASLAPARIWQLTDDEYVNVLKSALGISLAPADVPSTDPPDSDWVYTNFSERRTMSAEDVQAYDRAAEAVAAHAVANIASLVPCAVTPADAGASDAGADEACIEGFLRKSAARAFRRPVSDEELADWMALYRLAAATDGPAAGVGLVLQEIVMSPYFLFRTELGTAAATAAAPVALTPYELASALSFMFLDSSPDDPLWQAAENGTLPDPGVLAAQVDRLMALPETQANLTRKGSYWLGTAALPVRGKNTTIFPEYTESLEHDLEASAAAFVRDVFFNGKLADLLDSSTVYVNERLGAVYGIPGAVGTDMTRLDATAPERGAGILSQPAALAAMNRWDAVGDPIDRGLFVYRALLCGGDAGDISSIPHHWGDPDPAMIRRQRDQAAERARTACRACHALFDPIGLTFERYDAIGRYSETKYVHGDPLLDDPSWETSPTPIDASAILEPRLGSDVAGPVNGVKELAKKLKGAEKRVAFCAAKHLAESSLGYDPRGVVSCSLRNAQDDLHRTGSFTHMYRTLVASPGFRVRDPGK